LPGKAGESENVARQYAPKLDTKSIGQNFARILPEFLRDVPSQVSISPAPLLVSASVLSRPADAGMEYYEWAMAIA